MPAKSPQQRNHRRVLEYVLDDFLELKTSLTGELTKPIKEFLLSQCPPQTDISTLEGFRLASQLVLIDPTCRALFDHLILLNPLDGKIHVHRL